MEIDPLLAGVIVLMLLSGRLTDFLLAFLSIALHEAGHAVFALKAGAKISVLRIMPVGLSISFDRSLNCIGGRVAMNLAGPLVNILLVLAGMALRICLPALAADFFIPVNISLAVINLVPVLPLDGGKLFREALSFRLGFLLANSVALKASYFLSFALIILGAVQFLGTLENFSLFIVGVYILFSLNSEKAEGSMMNIKNIIFRKSRLLRKGVYPSRSLVVLRTLHLGDVLKSMDFDRFHIIHILNDDLKILGTITEQELMDAMLLYNTDTTFEEYLSKRV